LIRREASAVPTIGSLMQSARWLKKLDMIPREAGSHFA
jgi:hypothetical protein